MFKNHLVHRWFFGYLFLIIFGELPTDYADQADTNEHEPDAIEATGEVEGRKNDNDCSGNCHPLATGKCTEGNEGGLFEDEENWNRSHLAAVIGAQRNDSHW